MIFNHVKTIEIDNVEELDNFLNKNFGWVPFAIVPIEPSDRLLEKNYIVWLRYGG